MTYFQTKNPNLGTFWRVLHLNMLVHFMANLVNFPGVWYILWHFGLFCGHLVSFPRLGILCHKKSGNPAPRSIFVRMFGDKNYLN
jgi:hypothetical protein